MSESDHGRATLGVHLPVAAQPSLDGLVDVALRAEERGYERVWMPETWGRDAVTALAVMAERTDEVGLGSSLFNVYSRSPTLVGQTAVTLQEASEGRFRVGVGPSGPAVVERWHGVDFDRPLRRTREYVEILRRVFSGETVRYRGDCFELDGFRLRCGPPETPPPVDVGGMGPKAVELAGRFADGWHALMCSPDGLRTRLADLERGASLGDRSVDEVHTTLVLPCAVSGGDDDEGGEGRACGLVTQHVAFYVGGMGTFYRDALDRQGYPATRAHEAWQNGDREEALAVVEGFVDDLAVSGTPAEAREALTRFRGIDGLDEVAIAFPRGATDGDVAATVAGLAPERGGD
ncbi:TIGR04024 family LLM class F420-dependent oxidoreductase [Salinigranum rubrum]|uniref:TIGR04024 family LLM class F420-dependent oxidoreductase n=1 Tax=Salinigranum rubrum TaxID=755307 RepID=A0A2I8VM49_9EURY|nr:TIGR04024 family LLM class F420-dependent oxidoreductase [Salinigranum rubrum]AUV83003.1 TIGR04024 family LLM class F420-dependent oxidoreductase [Salinigranum rubrum]